VSRLRRARQDNQAKRPRSRLIIVWALALSLTAGVGAGSALAGCLARGWWGNNCLVSTRHNQVSDLTTAIQTVINHDGRLGHAGRIDGIFGRWTRGGVVDFQKGTRIRSDGIVGRETWRRLAGQLKWAKQIGNFKYYGLKVLGWRGYPQVEVKRVPVGRGRFLITTKPVALAYNVRSKLWWVYRRGKGWVVMDSSRT